VNITQRAIKALFWMLLRLIYRVKVRARSNIPFGAAVLIPNHVSFIDAVLIASHIDRPVHFAMYWRIYKKIRWIARPMGAFPIASPTENKEVYDAAFRHIGRVLDRGELVCIFPEGMITHTGEMNEFKGGVKKILSLNPVPVIPVGLRGLWGSYFSRKKKGVFKLPDHFMAKIEMVVGQRLHYSDSLEDMQAAVAELVNG
jgi:1-acyl-sn-glycerol-3-phosphate acyltransferase